MGAAGRQGDALLQQLLLTAKQLLHPHVGLVLFTSELIQRLCQFRRCSREAPALIQKFREKKYQFFLGTSRLVPTVLCQFPYVLRTVELQQQLTVLDIPTCAVERGGVRAAPAFAEYKVGIRRAADPGGSGCGCSCPPGRGKARRPG